MSISLYSYVKNIDTIFKNILKFLRKSWCRSWSVRSTIILIFSVANVYFLHGEEFELTSRDQLKIDLSTFALFHFNKSQQFIFLLPLRFRLDFTGYVGKRANFDFRPDFTWKVKTFQGPSESVAQLGSKDMVSCVRLTRNDWKLRTDWFPMCDYTLRPVRVTPLFS